MARSQKWTRIELVIFKLTLGLLLLLFSAYAQAAPSNCFGLNEGCTTKRSSPVLGTSSSRLQVNPSSVPIEDGFGIEGIFYKSEVDLMLVRGTGRVGAAISPSNSESTFFGAPAIEINENYLQRRIESTKYPNHKITLATAAQLYDNKRSGLSRFELRLGLMGKYNKSTSRLTAGGGLSGTLGPMAFSYSNYDDETELDYQEVFGPSAQEPYRVRYKVQTYGAGLYLSSLILDYSHLNLKIDGDEITTQVDLYTASLVVSRFIFTASSRTENSSAYAYNPETKMLEPKQLKTEYFGGVQVTLSKNIMVGALYNYYLLREYSAALTLFF